MASHRYAHRASAPRAHAPRVAAQAAILAVVVGSTSAFTLLHKSATLDVDGHERHVQGFARTVGDLLAVEGITVGAHDLVAPALDQPVTATVVVRHARQLTVEIDGATETVWTTATDVGDAVDELGLRDADVRLSASRSDSLGRDVLRVSTRKTVHVVVDGETIDASTSGSTVRDALQDVGLVLGDGDQVSVPLDATAVDGLVVMVTRAATTGDTSTEAVPYDTQQVDDPSLPTGTTKVVTAGRAGLRTTTFQVQTVGGAVVSRTAVASVVSRQPVTEVVHVGTQQVPDVPAVTSVDPGSAQAVAQSMMAAHGWDDTQFSCLVALWDHESGWRVNAQNGSSGAYGIPQALPGSKMASVAADWQTNPATQITWGLGYIEGRYGTPCAAYAHLESSNWY